MKNQDEKDAEELMTYILGGVNFPIVNVPEQLAHIRQHFPEFMPMNPIRENVRPFLARVKFKPYVTCWYGHDQSAAAEGIPHGAVIVGTLRRNIWTFTLVPLHQLLSGPAADGSRCPNEQETNKIIEHVLANTK